MNRFPENHRRMRLTAAAFFLAAALSSFTGEAAAARGDKIYDHAWACSTLYSRAPIKVLNGDDPETATCLGEGKKGRPPMSRGDAWSLCREQFDTTTQFINWTSKGWHCRYYPR
ncbi:hypothetical protein [Taklimakanibacter deserti]|uniref:hypothetical protein n=1 Tax=Taklimakanibacter deserti TaxID=2267839 RepID=UPI0013C41F76